MHRLFPALLFAVAASPAFAQNALDPNRTVATVNGEEIKAAEYYRRVEWFRPDPQSALAGLPVGFQVLRQMISERMIVQLAKSKGVAPSAPQIDARLAELYSENPNLKAQLASAGRSEDEIRADLRNQEAQFNLMTAGITVTDLEVEKHYKDNPSEFKEPARYKLRILAVGDDATQNAVDAALKAGKPFADVAKQYSLDVTTKARGGEYGDVPETALSDESRSAVVITPVGSTTAWVRGPKNAQGEQSNARIKFFVEGITPAKTVPLDASLKNRLRRRLMLDRGSVKNKTSVGKELETATQAAKVTIAEPQFQQLYSQLLDRVRKAQQD
jgi:parvulin-like peptidyl-prolyl isomerase